MRIFPKSKPGTTCKLCGTSHFWMENGLSLLYTDPQNEIKQDFFLHKSLLVSKSLKTSHSKTQLHGLVLRTLNFTRWNLAFFGLNFSVLFPSFALNTITCLLASFSPPWFSPSFPHTLDCLFLVWRHIVHLLHIKKSYHSHSLPS